MRFNTIFNLFATCAFLAVTPSFAMDTLVSERSLTLQKHSADIESLKYLVATHRFPPKKICDLKASDWNHDENDFHPLSHKEFMDLQKNGWITKEQAEELIKYAYETFNPILFRQSDQVIDFPSYVIMPLFIHRKKQNLQKTDHLMGANDEMLKTYVLNPIIDWHSKQPQANFSFWYDDEMITNKEEVINNTKRILSDKGVNLEKLEFKSIRIIDIVRQNPRLFSEDVPVACRADFAKVLTAQFSMKFFKYVINTDHDIGAVTREQLFDAPTLCGLEMGYVFGSNVGSWEENSFIMLNKERAYEIHNDKMITDALQVLNQKIAEGNMNIDQEIYYLYKPFRRSMQDKYKSENNGKVWTTFGKPMIFPPTQYGGENCGYNAQQIDCLQKALQ